MYEAIQRWLSSPTKDWQQGVALYMAHGQDLLFKRTLLMGQNEFARKRLVRELDLVVGAVQAAAGPVKPDADVLAAVTAEAHKTWKELANMRARLFALCKTAPWDDENAPQKVQLRGEMALDILKYHDTVVVPAYNRRDYVLQHGQLPPPETVVATVESTDHVHVPDHMLKATIDNLRKNLSKIRKREPTPERLQLIASHEATLENLLNRWHSLK